MSHIRAANQRVIDVGCVMAVPTTAAHAPMAITWVSWSGVWIRPSHSTGVASPKAATIRPSRSKSGPSVFLRSPVYPDSVVEIISIPDSTYMQRTDGIGIGAAVRP